MLTSFSSIIRYPFRFLRNEWVERMYQVNAISVYFPVAIFRYDLFPSPQQRPSLHSSTLHRRLKISPHYFILANPIHGWMTVSSSTQVRELINSEKEWGRKLISPFSSHSLFPWVHHESDCCRSSVNCLHFLSLPMGRDACRERVMSVSTTRSSLLSPCFLSLLSCMSKCVHIHSLEERQLRRECRQRTRPY